MRRTSWQEMYDGAAAAGFDKQEYMAARLGPHAWKYDLHAATIMFQRKAAPEAALAYPAELLGFEDAGCDKFTWGWALDGDPGLPGSRAFPDKLFGAARAVRARGREDGIADLTRPVVRLRGRCGHQFALLAAHLTGLQFYYPCELERGHLLIGVRAPGFRDCIKEPLKRMARIFPRAVAELGPRFRDHYAALLGHAHIYEQVAEPFTSTLIRVGMMDPDAFEARFDPKGAFLRIAPSSYVPPAEDSPAG